jgi:hypothetical protein
VGKHRFVPLVFYLISPGSGRPSARGSKATISSIRCLGASLEQLRILFRWDREIAQPKQRLGFFLPTFHQFVSKVTGRSIPVTFTKCFTLNLTEIFAKVYSVGESWFRLLSAA